MAGLFETVTDLKRQAHVLRRRRYGVVEIHDGRFVGVHLRPWPKAISLPEVWCLGGRYHARAAGDRCWLYYNQPCRFPNFLALPYVVSSRGATLATFHGSLVVLDEIARVKQSDAILCDVTNARISVRLLARWGWEAHVPHSRRRHVIKRFYGQYCDPETAWAM